MASSYKLKELRCENCKQFYYNCENWETSCNYHPGTYRSLISGGSGVINMSQNKKWSCCKNIYHESKGCRVGYHEEDIDFSQFVSSSCNKLSLSQTSIASVHLPPRILHDVNTALMGDRGEIENTSENTEEKTLKTGTDHDACAGYLSGFAPVDLTTLTEEDRIFLQKGYQRHVVRDNDSLSRLALAYETTVEAIKKVNQLVVDRDLHGRPVIYIPSTVKSPALPPPPPVTEEIIHRRKLFTFMSLAKCKDKLEAEAYLVEHDWNVAIAAEARARDLEWEHAQMAPKASNRLNTDVKPSLNDTLAV